MVFQVGLVGGKTSISRQVQRTYTRWKYGHTEKSREEQIMCRTHQHAWDDSA